MPSALASAHRARSSAELPLVHDAYAILTADAAPGPPKTDEGLEGAGGEELGDALGARAGDVEPRAARLHGGPPD